MPTPTIVTVDHIQRDAVLLRDDVDKKRFRKLLREHKVRMQGVELIVIGTGEVLGRRFAAQDLKDINLANPERPLWLFCKPTSTVSQAYGASWNDGMQKRLFAKTA